MKRERSGSPWVRRALGRNGSRTIRQAVSRTESRSIGRIERRIVCRAVRRILVIAAGPAALLLGLVAAVFAAGPGTNDGGIPGSGTGASGAPAIEGTANASLFTEGGSGDGALSAPVVRLLDDFEDTSAWSAHPASGVSLDLSPGEGLHGHALRMDFHFSGGGYAVARRTLPVELPANYAFSFQLRGEAPVNTLEFKLLDASGENVWWHVRRDVSFPDTWQPVTIKKRQISFAWGPQGGGELRQVAAIEIVVTAGSGGTGSVWIDDLELRELPPPGATLPAPRAVASSFLTPDDAGRAIDGDTLTAWQAAPDDPHPTLTVDFQVEREFGGLVLTWEKDRHPADYSIETSIDGSTWRLLRVVLGSNGGRDPLLLTESEGRYLRIHAESGLPPSGVALREAVVQPLSWGESAEIFFRTLAREAPRGAYPRSILGEPVCWTVIGTDDGHPAEGIFDDDGRLEIAKAGPALEPFLFADGRLLTWADFERRPRLLEGNLPIPSVQWTRPGLELTITTFAVAADDLDSRRMLGLSEAASAATGGEAYLVARYRLRNLDAREQRATLFVTLRPFQSNPPAQFLNTVGGTARIHELSREGETILRDGRPSIHALTPFSAFGAATFDQGELVTDYLWSGHLPASQAVRDPFERAAAAMAWEFAIPPGGAAEAAVCAPMPGGGLASAPRVDIPSIGTAPATSSSLPGISPGDGTAAPAGQTGASARLDTPALDQLESRIAGRWRDHRRGIEIDLPASAHDLIETVRAQIAWILINRDGPGIQPGSRSYERSWIRDGSLTSTALLRLGHPEVVRDFLTWFAAHQYEDGKVPCCIDHRGADPVPEHDSHGELIYLAAEYYRYTRDLATAREVWPAVEKAAAYLDTLRRQRRTPEYATPEMKRFWGLLPPSISHEGYSAKPMHSYWDDFWGYRGFADAVFLAGALGEVDAEERIARSRDEFATDLAASIRASLRDHRIDYVPGCADLGDFDATSTTIALTPTAATGLIPPEALAATFERYWNFFDARRGGEPWEAFTPYEVRTIGAFIRLGWRDRAHELIDFFLAHRCPPAWRQWSEIVWSDSTTQRFLGDVPHTWVGSDFVRSALDLLAYEQVEEESLVLAAGVPLTWLREEDGVRVRNLPTPYGPLSYHAIAKGASVEMRIDGGIEVPPGGIAVALPETRAARVDGAPAPVDSRGRVIVRSLPAVVVVEL